MSEHFLRTFAVNESKKVKSFSFSVEEMLKNFDWKGNVRQLKNYIFRAVILCDDSALQPEHFPQILNADYSSDKIVFGIRDEVVHIFKEDGKSKTLVDIEEEIAKKLMEQFYVISNKKMDSITFTSIPLRAKNNKSQKAIGM